MLACAVGGSGVVQLCGAKTGSGIVVDSVCWAELSLAKARMEVTSADDHLALLSAWLRRVPRPGSRCVVFSLPRRAVSGAEGLDDFPHDGGILDRRGDIGCLPVHDLP